MLPGRPLTHPGWAPGSRAWRPDVKGAPTAQRSSIGRRNDRRRRELRDGDVIGVAVVSSGVERDDHIRTRPPHMRHELTDRLGRVGAIKLAISVVEEDDLL